MITVQKPQKIEGVFNSFDFQNFKSLFPKERVDTFEFQGGFSRRIVGEQGVPELRKYSELLIPMARQLFKSENLLPTYSLFSHYEGPEASLYRHKDDNACTYTIDMCIYQKYAWDLWVEYQPYTLLPNEALAYYGNDQLHWREDFPMKDTNHVAMVFFHFAEPDHWYFTKGPDYLRVIRNEISEEDWLNSR